MLGTPITNSYLNLGNKRLSALSKAIHNNQDITKYNFRKNSITPVQSEFLTNSFNNTIEDLDLSKNDIGKNGVFNLSTFLSKDWCNLRSLNVEGNKLGQENINVPLLNSDSS